MLLLSDASSFNSSFGYSVCFIYLGIQLQIRDQHILQKPHFQVKLRSKAPPPSKVGLAKTWGYLRMGMVTSQ